MQIHNSNIINNELLHFVNPFTVTHGVIWL